MSTQFVDKYTLNYNYKIVPGNEHIENANIDFLKFATSKETI